MSKSSNQRPRNVLITGAGGGLGMAVAQQFGQQGDTVLCVDIDAANVQQTAANIVEAGGSAHSFVANIGQQQSIDELVTRVHQTVGEISVLANVAGIMDRRQLRELSVDDFAKVMSVNLNGTYGMIRAFDTDIRSMCNGRIVNVASQSGTIGYEFPAYSTSKAAVIHLTRALMLDYWGTDVRINAVSPGPMETPMLNETMMEAFINATPAGRISTPAEVADVIVQLASPDQRLINGQNIVVDGGATSFFRWMTSDNWTSPYPV